MMTEQDIAKHFTPIQADTRVPVLDKEQLKNGLLARYDGTRVLNTSGGQNLLHTFTTRMGDGMQFATWGTGGLNQQLSKVKAGALIFLSYRGKFTADDNSGVEVHRWVVNVATTPRDRLPTELVEQLGPHADTVERAIVVAANAEAERFRDRVVKGGATQPGDDLGAYTDMVARDG